MLECLSGVLWSSEEQGVASGGSAESQLIQSQGLTSSSNDAGTSSSSESESGNAELGDGQETVVIGDGTDDTTVRLSVLARLVSNNARDGDGWSVDAGHEEAAENDLVEGRVGSA